MSGEDAGAPADGAPKIMYVDGFPVKVDNDTASGNVEDAMQAAASNASANTSMRKTRSASGKRFLQSLGSATERMMGHFGKGGSTPPAHDDEKDAPRKTTLQRELEDIFAPDPAGSTSAPPPADNTLFANVSPAAPPPQPPLQATAGTQEVNGYRARLVRFFRHYDWGRVPQVDALLAEHCGREEALLEELVGDFGDEPPYAESPFAARLEKYYNSYCLPTADLADLLDEYAGKEEELMKIVVARHGPEPDTVEEAAHPNGADPTLRRRGSSLTPEQHAAASALNTRLTRFYEKYCPAKLPMVDDMVQQMVRDGNENIFKQLVDKYGPEPDPDEDLSSFRSAAARRVSIGPGAKGPGAQGASRPRSGTTRSMAPPVASETVGDASSGGWFPHAPGDDAGQTHRNRLLRFYTHYNAAKVSSVDQLLRQYQGREDTLFQKLTAKYGPEPPPDAPIADVAQVAVPGADMSDMNLSVSSSNKPPADGHTQSPAGGSFISAFIRRKSNSPTPTRIRVRVTDDPEQLRALLEANPKLPAFDTEYAGWCGRNAVQVRENHAHATVALVFSGGAGAWFPKDAVAVQAQTPSPEPSEPESPADIQFKTPAEGLLKGDDLGNRPPREAFALDGPPAMHVGMGGDDDDDAVGAASMHVDPKEASVFAQGPPGQRGDAEEDEEDEEEEEKEKAPEKPEEANIMGKEYVISSHEYAKEYSGTYTLVEGEEVNGYPVWERKKKNANEVGVWLFSTPSGEWRITDDRQDFPTGDGYFNTDVHDGRPPHKAGPWLGEDDEPDKNILCKLVTEEQGDRVIGGNLVVGRVAAELTEEQLQYASFQRRKKFKVKKDVPVSSKCKACRKFEAVCSKCYMNHRKIKKERREYLTKHYSSWPLERKVNVFFASIAQGEEDEVKAMLDHGANVDWMSMFKPKPTDQTSLPKDGVATTPMHIACAYHQPDVALVLITAGARYRRDTMFLLPLDYISDDNCAHDITMYLQERNNEYETAMVVQDAWDMYHDENFEEARDAFFELIMQYPTRDSCHIGLIFCHLELGDIDACVEAATHILKSDDIQWIETRRETAEDAIARADAIYHERCHLEETEGCVKACGCVIYPEMWQVPLKKLRRLDFKVVEHIFGYLPCSAAWQTWLAVHRSPLLRSAVDSHVTAACHVDKADALSIITTVPAWLASFREAVIDQVYDTWEANGNNTKLGELALCQIDNVHVDSIPTFPYFMVKVRIRNSYVVKTAMSKFKGWLGGFGNKSKQPSPARATQGTVFTLTLEQKTDPLGIDFVVHDITGSGPGRMKVCGIKPGSAADRAGLLPGELVGFDGAHVHGQAEFEKLLKATREKGKLSFTIAIDVDVREGSAVEATVVPYDLQFSVEAGQQGIVTKVNIDEKGGMLQVNYFGSGEQCWTRPAHVKYLSNSVDDGGTERDSDTQSMDTSIAPSSRFWSPSASQVEGGQASSAHGGGEDAYADYPQPMPNKASRNAGFEAHRAEKARFRLRVEEYLLNAQLLVGKTEAPFELYQSVWPEWKMSLLSYACL